LPQEWTHGYEMKIFNAEKCMVIFQLGPNQKNGTEDKPSFSTGAKGQIITFLSAKKFSN